MNELLNEIEDPAWSVLVKAAKHALEKSGYVLDRIPGRGRSNVWIAKRGGKSQRISIRTTKDRWIAFPPLKKGTEWKTLDHVDLVAVAAVDDRNSPRNAQVYLFNAGEVRERFNASYSARIKAHMTVRDNFGMWINLDKDNRASATSVGSGLANNHEPIATYPLAELLVEDPAYQTTVANVSSPPSTHRSATDPSTIAAIMDWARHRIASLSGVPTDAVKLDLKIGY